MTSAGAPDDLLAILQSGRRDALDALVPLVYEELRVIAHRHLARGHAGTLDTTALVNEAYLKLVDQSRAAWRDRAHFLALAAVAMRHVLTDRARARIALKRGGVQHRVSLDEQAIADDAEPEQLLEIDDALHQLADIDPRLARVVELRFFGGLSEEEIAVSLDVTTRTVRRDWVKARILLRHALGAADA
ncbi:MAG TPA: ECF-type sigma factor [Gemmatimonas sp.]|uniref:ECF-type sigma factor n=1 Tax=Gemmatimonas sp. TaxID=1962908 RepID=UPI002EDBAAB6